MERKHFVCVVCFNGSGSHVLLHPVEISDTRGCEWSGFFREVTDGLTPVAASLAVAEQTYLEGVPDAPWTEVVTLRDDDKDITFLYSFWNGLQKRPDCFQTKRPMVIFPSHPLPENINDTLRWIIPLALDNNVRKPLGLRGILPTGEDALTSAPLKESCPPPRTTAGESSLTV